MQFLCLKNREGEEYWFERLLHACISKVLPTDAYWLAKWFYVYMKRYGETDKWFFGGVTFRSPFNRRWCYLLPCNCDKQKWNCRKKWPREDLCELDWWKSDRFSGLTHFWAHWTDVRILYDPTVVKIIAIIIWCEFL